MIRRARVAAALLALACVAAASAQAGELLGKVFRVGDNGQKVFERNVVVFLVAQESSTITNDNGLFRLPIPGGYRPGETLKIDVKKNGWRIRYPLDGEVRIPAAPEKDLILIELLPVGSKLFLTDASIEKLIADAMRKPTAQAANKGEEPKVIFGRAIREWAQRYGLSAEIAKAEIDRWVAEVQQASGADERKLGLAAFAGQQFEKAADHFGLAAESSVDELAQIEKAEEALASRRRESRHTAASNYLDQGLALANSMRFEDAIRAYRRALRFVSPEEDRQAWALLHTQLGIALREQALRLEGEGIVPLMIEAVSAYQTALKVYASEQQPDPKNFAMALNSLGIAYRETAVRMSGGNTDAWLGQAVAAHQMAIEVTASDQQSQAWAMAQTNLGNALQELGLRSSGEYSLRLFGDAIEAHRRALEVFTRQQLPKDWAATQNNLGTALLQLGLRSSGGNASWLLAEAVAAFRSALEINIREQLPQAWAATQNNLGTALLEQGIRAKGEDTIRLLGEAAAAYRNALEVNTRELLPQAWAMSNHGLGLVLQEQGIRLSGKDSTLFLGEALAAFRSALEINTREQLPGRWVLTRAHEARVLVAMGRLSEAEAAFQELFELEINNPQTVHSLLLLYNDRHHDPAAALALARCWLGRNPTDGWVRTHLPEWFFATKNFSQCYEWSVALATMATPLAIKKDIRSSVSWTGYSIAALLAQDQAEAGISKLDELIRKIGWQAADFRTEWSFDGSLYFVHNEPELPQREALIALFEALGAPDRETILAGLRLVRERIAGD